ncbi:MAG: protoglobin domain-containing protein [Flavobacterium sp.]|uniref:protoglobin domain-containing protein n=1 Tax=Flavobacterium sp. TaxID=239 RepID=UPI0025C2C428|nr:protoglobin domain-containing protein [Flavobacterium sp.]MCK6608132.1 protoglobin domain-containing protein [Flavobacterium sp.]
MKKIIVTLITVLSVSAVSAQDKRPSGYTYGTKEVAKSPFSLEELKLLQQTLLFTEDDVKYLKMSHDILKDQTNDILDVWYGFVAGTPQLLYFFGNTKTGKPEGEYLAKVRERFKIWILQTAEANYDQNWLNYQYEIGLRHYTTKKNKTDKAKAVPIVNYRYIPALTIPVTTTLKPFLAKKGASEHDVDKMYNAWLKSVLLQSILWGQPYMKQGEF